MVKKSIEIPPEIMVPTYVPMRLVLAENRFCIRESQYYAGNDPVRFSRLVYCLGLILSDPKRRQALAVHLEHLHSDPALGLYGSQQSARLLIENLQYIADIQPIRCILMSPAGGEYAFHHRIEEAVSEMYDISCEHYRLPTGIYLPQPNRLVNSRYQDIAPGPTGLRQWR